jgi:N-acetylmuramoyl-L-alanine amidase
MRQIDYIVLHCTAGPQTQTLESIRAWWKQLGWKRPGYHRLIAADGLVHNLVNYSEITNGVHGYNRQSIHISYIGGVSDTGRAIDNRTEAQKREQEKLVREAAQMFPKAVVLGHRDFSPDKNRSGIIDPNEWMKTCPSFSVKTWLKDIGFKAAQKEYCRTNTDNVNLRSGGGTQFSVVRVLPAGTPVERITTKNGWSFCQLAGMTGWIKNDLLIQI